MNPDCFSDYPNEPDAGYLALLQDNMEAAGERLADEMEGCE